MRLRGQWGSRGRRPLDNDAEGGLLGAERHCGWMDGWRVAVGDGLGLRLGCVPRGEWLLARVLDRSRFLNVRSRTGKRGGWIGRGDNEGPKHLLLWGLRRVRQCRDKGQSVRGTERNGGFCME